VTATKGSAAPNSIGSGESGTCGTIKFADETADPSNLTDGEYYYGYDGSFLEIVISTKIDTNDTLTLIPLSNNE